jgi:P-type Ca2+ transporter type 2C
MEDLMSAPTVSTPATVAGEPWHAMTITVVADALGCDPRAGLREPDAAERLARYGPNVVQGEKPPSRLQIALRQLRDPMNVMLVAVAVVSIVIAQGSTAAVVLFLITLNVVLATNQELKAQASVAALADLQVAQARVLRDGNVQVLAAADLVPGDIVLLEAGDVVPADGRVVEAATLEVQEAALTGESVPVAKGVDPVPGEKVALGDRSSMLFQGTSVTRGTGRVLVTATGLDSEVGHIATMVTDIERTTSPLQQELDDLTRKIGYIAWGTLAVILVVGLVRGLEFSQLMLLGVSMAISAIPTGMPTFVQSMLAVGARQLAAAQAIVRNLSDVETLGATSQINTDKTGTLTMNEMTARRLWFAGSWYTIDGEGYDTVGAVRGAVGAPRADADALAYVSALANDATVTPHGAITGDPTEAALVVLAEKLGVSVEETRRAYPRIATVPFDSSYKFMATFHSLPYEGQHRLVGLVKGGPDVILSRCTRAMSGQGIVPIDQVRDEVEDANRELGEQGLRVLALAVRVLDGPDPDDDEAARAALVADPMAAVSALVFLGLVGIIDPLRPEAVEAVRTAHRAGIDVRMITGDHLVTAQAIGRELGLGEGGLTGGQFAAMPETELAAALPGLHIFGRVSPQDKLRLVQVMQRQGSIVAMTGDAVNDAAALKQADIGVAMGSGSEVSKQAAKMVLTDDNFATLVHAVALGRAIFARITSYIGYQLVQLFGLVGMFLLATVFDINSGVALLPMQVLLLNFSLAVVPVVIISLDDPAPGLMDEGPRDPSQRILNRTTAARWAGLGGLLAVVSILPVALGPDTPSVDSASVSLTMGFVVMGLATGLAGLVMRRTTAAAWTAPLLQPALITAAGLAFVVAATETEVLQRWLDTTALTGGQWLACLGLAGIWAGAVEVEKAGRRARGRRVSHQG